MTYLKIKFGLFSLLVVLAVSVFLTSCEQEVVPLQTSEIDAQKITEQRSELAKHLSILIAEQPEFKQTLKTMCLAEKENGYYEREFFFNIEKDKTSELFDGGSLGATLSARSVNLRKTIDFLTVNDPGLAILMIGDENSTKFNTRVYIDNGFDDSDPTAQIEYYENGVFGSHSISEQEPSATTFIVRESEAYLSPTELVLENPADVTKIGTVGGHEINVFGYNSAISEASLEIPNFDQNEVESRWCQRDGVGGKERLYYIRTSNTHDGWKGSGEFIFDIVFADNGSGITSLRARYTGIDKNKWYLVNKQIITWTANNDLDRMKYRIMEDDSGATYTISLGLSGTVNGATVSGSVQVSYTDDDDFVGETIVEYCDPLYNYGYYPEYAGAVTFLCKQQ